MFAETPEWFIWENISDEKKAIIKFIVKGRWNISNISFSQPDPKSTHEQRAIPKPENDILRGIDVSGGKSAGEHL